MNLTNLFSGWKYDVRSAIVTVLVAPVVIYLLLIVRKYVKSWGAYALEGVMYWATRTLKHSIAAALTLKRYCRQRLAEENRYLFVPSSLDIKLDIDRMFVPLTIEGQGTEKAVYSHANVLEIGNRLRIIGDPGSGKSSLVKRLFRDACNAGLVNPRKSKLPILVELRHLVIPQNVSKGNLGKWFVSHLRADLAKREVYQMGDCFDSYSTTSGLLVLLDGLDEVSSERYARVEEALNGLSVALGRLSENNSVVLTMRAQFHQQVKDHYRDHYGHALSLKPFTPTDIYDFLSRWPFPSKAHEHMARIYKELTDRPTLREMCSNPLILSMYVAEDQTSDHVVAPDSRTEFYKKICDELIIKRRLQQTGPTTAYTTLREQRERILGRLAFDHLLDSSQPANSLHWDDALSVVQSVMKCSKEAAATMFRDLAKETGLISEERIEQSFRFIHLTFCEFLAAFEAVQGQEKGWDTLIRRHEDFQTSETPQLHSRLIEVIPFASGLLLRVRREAAISEVANLGDNALLARTFLETKLYSHPCWSTFIHTQRIALTGTPEDRWDAGWLRSLHLFNVVVRDAKDCATHIPQSEEAVDMDAFFQSLVKQQKESLSKLLAAYAAQDAAAAFRLAELSNCDLARDFPEIIVEHCDQSPFFALVIQHARGDKHGRVPRWTTLLAAAGFESFVVAQWLSRMAPLKEWSAIADTVPPEKRWSLRGMMNESLYTQCISIATLTDTAPPTPLFSKFLRIPAPGAFRAYAVGLPAISLLLAAAAALSLLWFKLGQAGAIGATVLAFAGYTPMLMLAEIRRLYSRVIFPSRWEGWEELMELSGLLRSRRWAEPGAIDISLKHLKLRIAMTALLSPLSLGIRVMHITGFPSRKLFMAGRLKELRASTDDFLELRASHQRASIETRLTRLRFNVPAKAVVRRKKQKRR